MPDATTTRLQAIRAEHRLDEWIDGGVLMQHCGECGQPWPCDAALLGDVALAAAAISRAWHMGESLTYGVPSVIDRLDAALAAVGRGDELLRTP